MISIPEETSERFSQSAKAAVDALRHELLISTENNWRGGLLIARVFEDVFAHYLRETFMNIAEDEFARLGREHVRKIVLTALDSFMEQGLQT